MLPSPIAMSAIKGWNEIIKKPQEVQVYLSRPISVAFGIQVQESYLFQLAVQFHL